MSAKWGFLIVLHPLAIEDRGNHLFSFESIQTTDYIIEYLMQIV